MQHSTTRVVCYTQFVLSGGEMFHHLDLAGAFDEATAMFYAGNVLLALEHLRPEARELAVGCARLLQDCRLWLCQKDWS